jgi:hypothetical protein
VTGAVYNAQPDAAEFELIPGYNLVVGRLFDRVQVVYVRTCPQFKLHVAGSVARSLAGIENVSNGHPVVKSSIEVVMGIPFRIDDACGFFFSATHKIGKRTRFIHKDFFEEHGTTSCVENVLKTDHLETRRQTGKFRLNDRICFIQDSGQYFSAADFFGRSNFLSPTRRVNIMRHPISARGINKVSVKRIFFLLLLQARCRQGEDAGQ